MIGSRFSRLRARSRPSESPLAAARPSSVRQPSAARDIHVRRAVATGAVDSAARSSPGTPRVEAAVGSDDRAARGRTATESILLVVARPLLAGRFDDSSAGVVARGRRDPGSGRDAATDAASPPTKAALAGDPPAERIPPAGERAAPLPSRVRAGDLDDKSAFDTSVAGSDTDGCDEFAFAVGGSGTGLAAGAGAGAGAGVGGAGPGIGAPGAGTGAGEGVGAG